KSSTLRCPRRSPNTFIALVARDASETPAVLVHLSILNVMLELFVHLAQAKQVVPEWLRKSSGLSQSELDGDGTSNNGWGN
ncbi:hypothetical protein PMAYCL1PPCAC_25449, partial [Pristionchus mayeri]